MAGIGNNFNNMKAQLTQQTQELKKAEGEVKDPNAAKTIGKKIRNSMVLNNILIFNYTCFNIHLNNFGLILIAINST